MDFWVTRQSEVTDNVMEDCRDKPPSESLWWRPHVRDFRTLSSSQDPSTVSLNRDQSTALNGKSATVAAGASFTSIAVNVPRYLLYLLSQAERLGARVLKTRVPTTTTTTDGNSGSGLNSALTFVENLLAESESAPVSSSDSGSDSGSGIKGARIACFVNATGLAASTLCNDKMMYPIRGQTVLVNGEADAIRARVGDGYIAYCIPRPGSGTSILGGTNEVGAWNERADEGVTREILGRCRDLAPELVGKNRDGGFEVVSVQVGLRPARRGGARMEQEIVKGRKVVHVYGHAGAGYVYLRDAD